MPPRPSSRASGAVAPRGGEFVRPDTASFGDAVDVLEGLGAIRPSRRASRPSAWNARSARSRPAASQLRLFEGSRWTAVHLDPRRPPARPLPRARAASLRSRWRVGVSDSLGRVAQDRFWSLTAGDRRSRQDVVELVHQQDSFQPCGHGISCPRIFGDRRFRGGDRGPGELGVAQGELAFCGCRRLIFAIDVSVPRCSSRYSSPTHRRQIRQISSRMPVMNSVMEVYSALRAALQVRGQAGHLDHFGCRPAAAVAVAEGHEAAVLHILVLDVVPERSDQGLRVRPAVDQVEVGEHRCCRRCPATTKVS